MLKRLFVTKHDADGGIEEIELRSDNPAFEPIVLGAGDAEIAVRAEFLDVLGWHRITTHSSARDHVVNRTTGKCGAMARTSARVDCTRPQRDMGCS